MHGAYAINNIVDDTSPVTKKISRTANFEGETEVEETTDEGVLSRAMTGRRVTRPVNVVSLDADGAMEKVGVSLRETPMGLTLGKKGVLFVSSGVTGGVVVGVAIPGVPFAIPGDSVGTVASRIKSGQLIVLAVSYAIVVQAMGCLLPSAI